MNHIDKRRWLIEQLLAEDEYYKDYDIPTEEKEQKNLLRGLMNVRSPRKISPDFLSIQDEYLQE